MEYVALGGALVACIAVAWLLGWGTRARRVRRELLHLIDRLDPGFTGVGDGARREAVPQLAEAIERVLEASADSRRLASALVTTLDAIPLGVVIEVWDGRLAFRNHAASSMLGTSVDDSLTAHALARLLGSARAGQAATEVLELFGPPRRTLSVSAFPLNEAGPLGEAGPVDEGGSARGGAAAIIEDVSERRRLESVRRDFVANVSHELKTPVGALGLLAETMVDEDDTEVLQQLAERVQTEASRVASIVEDLINLSRLEAEEAPRHEPVQVSAVVTEAVEQVHPAAGLHDVEIAITEPPSEWTVLGDRRQLVSALFHLVENAVKYSDPGSSVEVRSHLAGQSVQVTVRDYGPGIPSRDLHRIFERFYRVDRGRSRHTGGTGLGLAIARHVASNHGGEVLVESREGEGSLFTLRLPLAASDRVVGAESA